MKTYQKITVVLKPDVINDFYNLLPNLKAWLEKRKKQIQFIDSEKDRLKKIFRNQTLEGVEFLPLTKIFKNSDLIISLGGDGTLLGVCRKSKGSKAPIFGVNMGHLGFLTEFHKNDFFEHLNDLFNDQFEIKKQNLFKVKVTQNGKVRFEETFLNDAVINKKDIARMFTLKVEGNGELIYNISGDGLILSSPLGSTAYSLAAGGPIIHPEVKALLLTPICAHGLTHRPLALPEQMVITAKTLHHAEHVLLTLDGQVAIDVTSKDNIEVSLDQKKHIFLVKNPERNFFQTLKEKFDYGRRD